jgi:coenzyme PQQ synthesis protein D (PqqD)
VESGIEPPGPTVVESEIAGCLALFHPDKAEVLLLNETASDVWRLIDGQLTLEAIVLALSHAYGVDPDAIRADVGRTVVLLRTHGFLG